MLPIAGLFVHECWTPRVDLRPSILAISASARHRFSTYEKRGCRIEGKNRCQDTEHFTRLFHVGD